MPALVARQRGQLPYWARFSFTVAALMVFTSGFVLVVLPQRFVLQSGLVESGITFPTGLAPFLAPGTPPVVPARATPPSAPAPPAVSPGPAEEFWNALLPLLRDGQWERAVPLFRAYLAAQPGDWDVWREFAVVLTKLERYDEAERIYVRLRAVSADPESTLRLARLIRDRGDPQRALALYQELVGLRPEDDRLRREYAQALSWAAQYGAAATEYRRLIERRQGGDTLTLDLARVLYWNGQRTEALAVLATLPDSSPQAAQAAGLRAAIERELSVAAAPAGSPLQRARDAVAARDFDEATRRYRELLAREPDRPEVGLEWADFLQYQLEDLAAARDALRRLALLRDLTWRERFRLAQLHAWTGDEAEARALLTALLREDSTSVQAWALLGDLYRFGDERLAARDAYRSALRLDPADARAVEGTAQLTRQATEMIESRERPSAGPEVLYFGDSDAYRRWDLGARATVQWGPTVLLARAGHRTLDGVALDGQPASQRGPYFQLELARWWRLGTVRTSVAAGFEHLDAFGTEPTIAVRVALPDASRTSIQLTYEHGPAFHRTVTLESVLGAVRSDYLEASVYRGLGAGWSLAGLGAATSLRGGGGDNWRFNGFVTLRRQLSTPISIAFTSQALTFTAAAPVMEDRRLYWDPTMFVAGGLQIEARVRTATGWDMYGRLGGGAGLVRERLASAYDLVPQFSTEAGVRYDTRRITFNGGVAYLRGREGAYQSFGATASLGVRY